MVFKLNYKLFISLYAQIAFEWGGHLCHSIRSLVAIQAWDVFRLSVVEY